MGHLKADHRMNRNHYLGQTGDAINATLSAAGFNLRICSLSYCAFLLNG